MVSKFDHCLVDLLYRWGSGELPVDIPLIVSNHPDLAPVASATTSPSSTSPSPGHRAGGGGRAAAAGGRAPVDFVVLARYMQILSTDLCGACPAGHQHPSLVPAGLRGAEPYHQAHERGVKLIGATAHYVTADLDEGPIIEQDVVRVGHRHTAPELVAIGRDVERIVLARAVRLHPEHRVVLTGTAPSSSPDSRTERLV